MNVRCRRESEMDYPDCWKPVDAGHTRCLSAERDLHSLWRPFIFHDSGTYLLYGQHIANEIYSGQGSHSLGDVQQDYVGARSPLIACFSSY
jgi:hypothetical protein